MKACIYRYTSGSYKQMYMYTPVRANRPYTQVVCVRALHMGAQVIYINPKPYTRVRAAST
jgi:hypothetical protein